MTRGKSQIKDFRIDMKKIIKTEKAPLPVGPYNQAIQVDKTLYISGQVAINPKNNEIIKGSIEDATELIMKNIESILKKAGFDFNDVVRSKIYLTDMNNFSKVNSIYGSYFEKNQEPARTTIEVSGLPLGVDVEIDMIAVN
tara:strand:- start:596 stop:1018 length:423 start_codon:yes stop_codon:yes gene_type:complete